MLGECRQSSPIIFMSKLESTNTNLPALTNSLAHAEKAAAATLEHTLEKKSKGQGRVLWRLFILVAAVQSVANYFLLEAILYSQGVDIDRGSFSYYSLCILFAVGSTAIANYFVKLWLVDPLQLMKRNFAEATLNPDSHHFPLVSVSGTDEIAQTISAAQNMMKRHAENLLRVRTNAEEEIQKIAHYDPLTSLPNRMLFLQKMHEMVEDGHAADGTQRRFALVAVDLDNFQDINDSVGHHIGDIVLKIVAKRLKTSLPASALIARTGEDEFLAFLPLKDGSYTARDVGERIRGVIRNEPAKIYGENFPLRASIGISKFPDDGLSPEQVLKNASLALNRAKQDGRDTVREYLEDFDRALAQRLQILRDLREALEHDKLALRFQPQIDLKTGKIYGAEALLAWYHTDTKTGETRFIPPDDYITLAEQSGIIVPLGEWVLRRSCLSALEWQRAGFDYRVAVNVSSVQFHQSDLAMTVKSILAETGLAPEKLEIEITESAFLSDLDVAVTTLNALKKLGVEVAIDDFGTGYSSLSYLRRFPLDRLKIDKTFIIDALSNDDDAVITKAIIALGHSLGVQVLAEGVETKEHEAFLLAHGCDEAQGYFYARPMMLPDLLKFTYTAR